MKGHILLGGGLIVGVPLLAHIAGLTQLEQLAVAALSAAGWVTSAYRTLALIEESSPAKPAQANESWSVAESAPPAQQTDFHFGRVYRTDSGEPYLGLSDVAALAKYETTASFTLHLARVLESMGPSRSIVLLGETSYPDFQSIIEKIANEKIGKLVIRGRSDVNPNVRTLECSVHLIHGTVHVRPQWTGWQPVRADEIVSTLLVPLASQSLLGRVVTENQDGQQEALPGDLMGIVERLLALSGYPYSRDDLNSRMSDYLKLLNQAQACAR